MALEALEEKREDIAVFLDFENIYISLRNTYDATPNFEYIMDKCSEYGRVVMARAYADWYRYPRVTNALYANSLEPMYVPTYYYGRDRGREGGAIKNSVDMHLVIDIMRTLYERPQIITYILVTGDRDFIPLVNALRQQGKHVVVIGVAGAASTHLAQSADEFIFYRQLIDEEVEEKPEEKAEEKDVFRVLVDAVHLARQRGYACTLASLKLLMVELLGEFDESKYQDSQGRHFSKFKGFVREAERRGLVQIFTSGTVNEVFLPNEDPYTLSQFVEREVVEEEEGESELGEIKPEYWDIFIRGMRQFDDPVLFVQIYNMLRGLRNQEVLDLSNREIRGMIKKAISEGILLRKGRGMHGYYRLSPEHTRQG